MKNLFKICLILFFILPQFVISQNVGIGTSNPLSKLHVMGDLQTQDGGVIINDNYGTISFRNGGIGKAYMQLTGTPSYDLVLSTTVTNNTTGNIKFQIQGATKMVLDEGGRVGIGTISPNVNYKLDVVGSGIRSEGNNWIEDGYLNLRNSTDGKDWRLSYSNPSARFQISEQGANRMVIANGGNVGIGYSTPSEQLDVNGNIRGSGTMVLDNVGSQVQLQNGGVNKAFLQLSGENLRLGTNSGNTAGKIVFRVNGDESIQIDNSGNMGIGASTALSHLHIGSGADAGFASATSGYIMLGQYSGSNLIMDNNEIMTRGANGIANSLILQNDGGSVRIGSVAVPSGYKFAINGKMICEELKVKLASSGWPDYVFANNYKLKGLDEVEDFIKLNKHLPNIPSARDVETNGLEVGDMQKRMMEKIEELTLYVIELKKEIDIMKNVKPQNLK